jgi:hypothetical protein
MPLFIRDTEKRISVISKDIIAIGRPFLTERNPELLEKLIDIFETEIPGIIKVVLKTMAAIIEVMHQIGDILPPRSGLHITPSSPLDSPFPALPELVRDAFENLEGYIAIWVWDICTDTGDADEFSALCKELKSSYSFSSLQERYTELFFNEKPDKQGVPVYFSVAGFIPWIKRVYDFIIAFDSHVDGVRTDISALRPLCKGAKAIQLVEKTGIEKVFLREVLRLRILQMLRPSPIVFADSRRDKNIKLKVLKLVGRHNPDWYKKLMRKYAGDIIRDFNAAEDKFRSALRKIAQGSVGELAESKLRNVKNVWAGYENIKIGGAQRNVSILSRYLRTVYSGEYGVLYSQVSQYVEYCMSGADSDSFLEKAKDAAGLLIAASDLQPLLEEIDKCIKSMGDIKRVLPPDAGEIIISSGSSSPAGQLPEGKDDISRLVKELRPFADEGELFEAVYKEILNSVALYYSEKKNIEKVVNDVWHWRENGARLDDLSSEFLIRIHKTMVCEDTTLCDHSRKLFNFLKKNRFREPLKNKVNKIINVFKQDAHLKSKFKSQMGPEEVEKWMADPENNEKAISCIKKWTHSFSEKVIAQKLTELKEYLSTHALTGYEPWRSSKFDDYVEYRIKYLITNEAKKKANRPDDLEIKPAKKASLPKPKLKDLDIVNGQIDGIDIGLVMLDTYQDMYQDMEGNNWENVQKLEKDSAIAYVMSKMGYVWQDINAAISKNIDGRAGISYIVQTAKKNLLIMDWGKAEGLYRFELEKAWNKAMQEAKRNLLSRLKGKEDLQETAGKKLLSMLYEKLGTEESLSKTANETDYNALLWANCYRRGKEPKDIIIIHKVGDNGRIPVILGLKPKTIGYLLGFGDYEEQRTVVYVSGLQVLYEDEQGKPVYSSGKYPTGYCIAEVYLLPCNNRREKIGLKQIWINKEGKFCQKDIDLNPPSIEDAYEDFVFSGLEGVPPADSLAAIVKGQEYYKTGYINLPGKIRLDISSKFIGSNIEVGVEKDAFSGAVFFVYLLKTLIAKYRVCVSAGEKEVTKLDLSPDKS